jgi:hypothetical protein
MIFYGNMCQGTMSPVLYSDFSIYLDIQATTLRQASANNKLQDAVGFAYLLILKQVIVAIVRATHKGFRHITIKNHFYDKIVFIVAFRLPIACHQG